MPTAEGRQWHGMALVVFAGCIPLGEGLGLVGLALVILGIALRWRQIDWRVLTRGTTRVLLLGWALWIAAGLVLATLQPAAEA